MLGSCDELRHGAAITAAHQRLRQGHTTHSPRPSRTSCRPARRRRIVVHAQCCAAAAAAQTGWMLSAARCRTGPRLPWSAAMPARLRRRCAACRCRTSSQPAVWMTGDWWPRPRATQSPAAGPATRARCRPATAETTPAPPYEARIPGCRRRPPATPWSVLRDMVGTHRRRTWCGLRRAPSRSSRSAKYLRE